MATFFFHVHLSLYQFLVVNLSLYQFLVVHLSLYQFDVVVVNYKFSWYTSLYTNVCTIFFHVH